MTVDEKSLIIDKFIRRLTVDGKREKAEIILNKALKYLAETTRVGQSQVLVTMVKPDWNDEANILKSKLVKEVKLKRWLNSGLIAAKTLESKVMMNDGEFWVPLLNAIERVKPHTKVVGMRIAGTAYRVPRVLREDSALSYAIRWIVLNARKRTEKTMYLRLAAEIEEINLYKPSNASLKQRDEFHKLAESNRAFIN